jgi:hypothetical protein
VQQEQRLLAQVQTRPERPQAAAPGPQTLQRAQAAEPEQGPAGPGLPQAVRPEPHHDARPEAQEDGRSGQVLQTRLPGQRRPRLQQ